MFYRSEDSYPFPRGSRVMVANPVFNQERRLENKEATFLGLTRIDGLAELELGPGATSLVSPEALILLDPDPIR